MIPEVDKAVSAGEFLIKLADSDALWFVLAAVWFLAFMGMILKRMTSLEKWRTATQLALDDCLERDGKKEIQIAKQDRMISAMSAMYATLRGFLIAQGTMNPEADRLVVADMERLIKDNGNN